MEIKNIAFLQGRVETLNYFSSAFQKAMEHMGFSCFSHSIYDDTTSLRSNLVMNQTLVVTFNCMGMSGELEYFQNGSSLWNAYRTVCVNFLVDHPLYYHDQLSNISKYASGSDRTYILCVDRDHVDYIRQYYPEITHVCFMALAGSGIQNSIPFEEKKYPLLFTGNYTAPSTFDPYIERNGTEYAVFYREIIEDLLSDCTQGFHQVCIRHIKEALPVSTDQEIRLVVSKMLFLELYVRFTQRGNILKEIADAGLPLHIIGKGFEVIPFKKAPHYICSQLMPTAFCLEETAKSQISINIMPWFVNGSHDRVVSAMHCNTMSVSDPSLWLTEQFVHGEDIAFYQASDYRQTADMLGDLLSHPDRIKAISANGHKKALEFHSWNSRAHALIDVLSLIQL